MSRDRNIFQITNVPRVPSHPIRERAFSGKISFPEGRYGTNTQRSPLLLTGVQCEQAIRRLLPATHSGPERELRRLANPGSSSYARKGHPVPPSSLSLSLSALFFREITSLQKKSVALHFFFPKSMALIMFPKEKASSFNSNVRRRFRQAPSQAGHSRKILYAESLKPHSGAPWWVPVLFYAGTHRSSDAW